MSAGVKRVAARKGALTHAAVSRALPLERPYVLWDDAVVGFGLRIVKRRSNLTPDRRAKLTPLV